MKLYIDWTEKWEDMKKKANEVSHESYQQKWHEHNKILTSGVLLLMCKNKSQAST